MKLLIDENLTSRLTRALQAVYPGTCHVKEAGLEQTNDLLIWQWAQHNGYAILTQDADFEQLALLRGQPPKIIYLRFGNCSLLNLITRLEQQREVISRFLLDANAACLELRQMPLTASSAD